MGRCKELKSIIAAEKSSSPLVIEANDNQFRVVGIETYDKRFPYTWMALTLQNKDYREEGVFKMGGSLPLKIGCPEVRKLLEKEKTSKNVSLYLERHCKDK